VYSQMIYWISQEISRFLCHDYV